MIHPAKTLLLLAAAVATFWAVMAWSVGFDADFKVAAVISILCLGGKEFLDYRDSEQLEERYLWEQGREDAWDRRDHEWLRELD